MIQLKTSGCLKIIDHVESKLREKLNPEQISAWLREDQEKGHRYHLVARQVQTQHLAVSPLMS